MIDGYDQWKTASPYDCEIDIEENCPECNCDAPEVQDNDGFHIELWCPDCGHVFKVPAEKHCCHIKDGVTEENFLDVEGLTAE